MSKFRVGDRVRFIGEDNKYGSGAIKGRIYTVLSCNNFCRDYFNIELSSGVGWVRPTDIKPVKPEPDLETIVQNANDALAALRALSPEELEQIECQYVTAESWQAALGFVQHQLRIKPKRPVFEPYTIESTGWSVHYDDRLKEIRIGCKTFELKSLQYSLKQVLLHDRSVTEAPVLHATRRGVSYQGNVLPWEDAEELYERIKGL